MHCKQVRPGNVRLYGVGVLPTDHENSSGRSPNSAESCHFRPLQCGLAGPLAHSEANHVIGTVAVACMRLPSAATQ
jgi:hypothetical protein